MVVLSLPAILTLEITPACSNYCVGCTNAYAADRWQPALPASFWERWLSELGPEAVRIRVSGGEPSLHPDFERILEAAASFDAWVTVFTNGRWHDPAGLVRQIGRHKQLLGLLVSLHGAQPHTHEAFSRVPGSFGETVANVRLAVEQGIAVALSAVLTHQSCHEVDAIVDLGQRLGVQHVAFNRYIGPPLPSVEPSPSELRRAIGRIERRIQDADPVQYGECIPPCFEANSSSGCLAGVTQASIDPWGNVHPCTHSPVIIGSLHEASMAELWQGEALAAWRSAIPEGCADCAAYATCHGGCKAMPGRGDPLRRRPLSAPAAACPPARLPAGIRPWARVRLRPETFGYAVLGHGQVLPVRAEARAVIEACDGSATFADLAARFGQNGLDLLGEMWKVGMLEAGRPPIGGQHTAEPA